jgi:hypothetical protein
MRQRKLHTKWFTQGMSAQEKADIEQTVRSAEPTLQLLAKILRRELSSLERKYDYTSPAWQYELALDQGQKKKLVELIELLTPIIGDDPQ